MLDISCEVTFKDYVQIIDPCLDLLYCYIESEQIARLSITFQEIVLNDGSKEYLKTSWA